MEAKETSSRWGEGSEGQDRCSISRSGEGSQRGGGEQRPLVVEEVEVLVLVLVLRGFGLGVSMADHGR
jgi:hypothetical protein